MGHHKYHHERHYKDDKKKKVVYEVPAVRQPEVKWSDPYLAHGGKYWLKDGWDHEGAAIYRYYIPTGPGSQDQQPVLVDLRLGEKRWPATTQYAPASYAVYDDQNAGVTQIASGPEVRIEVDLPRHHKRHHKSKDKGSHVSKSHSSSSSAYSSLDSTWDDHSYISGSCVDYHYGDGVYDNPGLFENVSSRLRDEEDYDRIRRWRRNTRR